MARRNRRNPWVSVGEILTWVLFVALLFPAGFAGWAIGHYTSLGKSSGTRTVTVTAAATTQAATTTSAATTQATTTQAATTSAGTTTSAVAGNATAGVNVFTSSGCGGCHAFAPAHSNGAVGPDLDNKPQTDAKKANMTLAAFVRQSIVDPNAYISPGYPKGVMPGNYGKQLTKTQLDDLVAAIVKANGG